MKTFGKKYMNSFTKNELHLMRYAVEDLLNGDDVPNDKAKFETHVNEIIENDDSLTTLRQHSNGMRSDVARSPGNQKCFSHERRGAINRRKRKSQCRGYLDIRSWAPNLSTHERERENRYHRAGKHGPRPPAEHHRRQGRRP